MQQFQSWYRGFEDRTLVLCHDVRYLLLSIRRGGRWKTAAWRSKLWQMNWYGGRTNWDAISACLDGAIGHTELLYNESVCRSAVNRVTTYNFDSTRPYHWPGDPWSGSSSTAHHLFSCKPYVGSCNSTVLAQWLRPTTCLLLFIYLFIVVAAVLSFMFNRWSPLSWCLLRQKSVFTTTWCP